MKHECCGKTLRYMRVLRKHDADNRVVSITHVWRCDVCKRYYRQRARMPKRAIYGGPAVIHF
jgi:threonine dehydrogenase-like Zn-dependent dehydrogenase